MLHFGEKKEKGKKIPKTIGQNLTRFSKKSAKSWQILQNFVKNQQKIQQFLTKKFRLEDGQHLAKIQQKLILTKLQKFV